MVAIIKDYPVNSLDNIGYVCIETSYHDQWVLCLHKRRKTWECPGGHVEEGETPLQAAKRELFEETGAFEFDILPVWDYQVLDDEGNVYNNGRVYFAEVKKCKDLPTESEMKRIGLFDEIPKLVSYNRDDMIRMLLRAKEIYQKSKS